MKKVLLLVFGLLGCFFMSIASAQYTDASVIDNGGQQIGFVTCTDCNPNGLGDPLGFIYNNLNSLPEVTSWDPGDLVIVLNPDTGQIGGWGRIGFNWFPLGDLGPLSGSVQGIINSRCYLCVPPVHDD